MLVNFSIQLLVANTPFHETTKLLNQKGGSEEIRELDLYWKVTTSFQHFKYGIEIRNGSVNKDNSHSWVRISYGTVRYVNDYIKHDTENFADPQEKKDEFEQKDNLCSSCLLIQEKKTTKIQSISTTLYRVLHDTCKIHGRDIKMRYLGSILILESEKD